MTKRLEQLLSCDSDISMRFRRLVKYRPAIYKACALLAHSGDGLLIMLLAAIVFAFGGEYLRTVLLQLLVTLLVTAALIAALKYAIRRERPQGEDGARWSAVPEYDRYSFPSGHAARVAGVAYVLGATYPMIAWPMTVWATAVSLARVAVGAHHLADIVVGSICGLLVAITAQAIAAAL